MTPTTKAALLGALCVLMAACSPASGPAPAASAPAQPTQLEPSAATTPDGTGPNLPSATVKLADLKTFGSCNIEFLNNQPLEGGRLKADGFTDLVVTGWVIDDEGGTDGSPASLVITSSGSGRAWQIDDLKRTPRPDVVKARDGNSAYAQAGFQAVIPIEGMAAGLYRLAVVVGEGSAKKACGGNTQFEFSP